MKAEWPMRVVLYERKGQTVDKRILHENEMGLCIIPQLFLQANSKKSFSPDSALILLENPRNPQYVFCYQLGYALIPCQNLFFEMA
jgi:hypothetical protein